MVTPTRSLRRSKTRQSPRHQPRAARRPPPRAAAKRAPLVPHAALDPRFVEGIALFNRRQFFACHEVLEQLWLQTDGRARDFYRGLIQAAAACSHWSRGNLPGAMTLSASSRRSLRTYRPAYGGVDVEGFLQRSTELFTWLRRHRTRYEERLMPTIRWTAPPPTP